MFHEGGDPVAEKAFREIARLTGGAYARFDASAPGQLAGLLRAAATYAAGGRSALRGLAGPAKAGRAASARADEVRLQLTLLVGPRRPHPDLVAW